MIDPLAIYQFYANLGRGDLLQGSDDDGWIRTSVYGQNLHINVQTLGEILRCSSIGADIDELPGVTTRRDEVSHLMWEDMLPEKKSKHLRPRARLMERIIINTILPRGGSHEQVYEADHKVLYAIFSRMQVNWAQFVHDRMKVYDAKSKKTIPYAAYIMRILQNFNVQSFLSHFEEIPIKDEGARFLSLMHLPEFPPQVIPFARWQTDFQQARLRQQQPQQQQQPLEPGQTQDAPPPHHGFPPQQGYSSDSEIREARTEYGRDDSARQAMLWNQGVITSNQRALERNQRGLRADITGLERSFSTRMTKVESTMGKMMSMMKKVYRKTRGRSSTRSSSSSPSPTPPPPQPFAPTEGTSGGDRGKAPASEPHIVCDESDDDGEEEEEEETYQEFTHRQLASFQGLTIAEDVEYGSHAEQWPQVFTEYDRHQYMYDPASYNFSDYE